MKQKHMHLADVYLLSNMSVRMRSVKAKIGAKEMDNKSVHIYDTRKKYMPCLSDTVINIMLWA